MFRKLIGSTAVRVVLLFVVSLGALWYGRAQATCEWECHDADANGYIYVWVPGYNIVVKHDYGGVMLWTPNPGLPACSNSQTHSEPYYTGQEADDCAYGSDYSFWDQGGLPTNSGSFNLSACQTCT